MEPEAAKRLGLWVRRRYGSPMSHLKLQKLCFYVYGAALGHGEDESVGAIAFEPWDHGPVNRELWHEFKHFGASPIPVPTESVSPYDAPAEAVMLDALEVYGRIGAWALRQQSHLEQPWQSAFQARTREIDPLALRAHFRHKFGGNVRYPEYLLGAGSFELDGVPSSRFESLHDLAQALRES